MIQGFVGRDSIKLMWEVINQGLNANEPLQKLQHTCRSNIKHVNL